MENRSPHTSSHSSDRFLQLKRQYPQSSHTSEPKASKHSDDHHSPKLYDNSAVFKWPGIEALMEAYQRHVEGE